MHQQWGKYTVPSLDESEGKITRSPDSPDVNRVPAGLAPSGGDF